MRAVKVAAPNGSGPARPSRRDDGRRLRTILETGQEIVWECDANGVVTFVSPSVRDYLGFSPDEMIGLPVTRFQHPASRRAYADRLAAVLAGQAGGWWHQQARWVSKDGTEIYLDSTAVALHDGKGRVTGVGGTSRYPDANLLIRQHREVVRTRVLRTLMRQEIQIVFQPLVNVKTGAVIGAEALSRFPAQDNSDNPDSWFADAAEVGLAVELELLAVRKAMAEAAGSVPPAAYVSVNVSPETLTTRELVEAVLTGPIPAERLVLELTEHASVGDYESMALPLAEMRACGVRLAVDDAGAGYASFRHILRLAPNCIKLDRDVIAGIDHDPARRAFAAAVVMFAHDVDACVVAEGIETVDELRAVQRLGVQTGQGYLLGQPSHPRAWPNREHLFHIAGKRRRPGAAAG